MAAGQPSPRRGTVRLGAIDCLSKSLETDVGPYAGACYFLAMSSFPALRLGVDTRYADYASGLLERDVNNL